MPWPRRGAILGAVLISLVAGSGIEDNASGAPEEPLNYPTTLSRHTLPDFADLVAQVKPAVVMITSRLQVSPDGSSREADRGQALPFPFNEFPFNLTVPRRRAVEARASGFIIKADGTIVTNNHVVAGAASVIVTLDDGSQSSARILGRDPGTDTAVLKISTARPLPYLELGDSSTVPAGWWVVAMGNPFGLGGTATVGIISAQGRDVGVRPYEQFIQVDAPINQTQQEGDPVLLRVFRDARAAFVAIEVAPSKG